MPYSCGSRYYEDVNEGTSTVRVSSTVLLTMFSHVFPAEREYTLKYYAFARNGEPHCNEYYEARVLWQPR